MKLSTKLSRKARTQSFTVSVLRCFINNLLARNRQPTESCRYLQEAIRTKVILVSGHRQGDGDFLAARWFRLAAVFVTILAVLVSITKTSNADIDDGGYAAAANDFQIELYTIGQGDLRVEKYGHAALCIRYAQRPDLDLCFNYGTTDFSLGISLGWAFLRGRAQFWSSVSTRLAMLVHYQEKDRTIWRQVLPLSRKIRRKVAAKLAYDAPLDNRYYQYHHFHDNCSTRVRDIINDATDGALRGQDELLSVGYRGLAKEGFAEETWLLMGIDVLMSGRSDKRVTSWEAMFLPDYLRKYVHERLGVEPELIYKRKGRSFSKDTSGARYAWLAIAGVLVLLLGAAILTRRYQRLALFISLLPATLIGLTMWALMVISSLPELHYNEGLLVFVPIDIVVLCFFERIRLRYVRIRIAMIALASLLLALGVFRQPLWIPALLAFVPLVGAMLMRPYAKTEVCGS